jgi:hypothetical protein
MIMTLRKSALALALVTVSPFTSLASENGAGHRPDPSAHETILVEEITTSVNEAARTDHERGHPRQPTSRDNRETSDDER